MKYKQPGRFRDVEQFVAHWHGLSEEFGCDDQLLGADGPLGQPFRVGDRVIGNRFAMQPMEGWDGEADGSPSENTLRRWRRFGRSGAKLIWGGEAFAVSGDGRANPAQLFSNPALDVTAVLASLRAEVLVGHGEKELGVEDLYIGLQLTHSGRHARPVEGAPQPLIAHHHPELDARLGIPVDAPLLTDGELEGIAERFVATARSAQAAGFDFIDVKCCHGYLLHEVLAAKTRPGAYGGSFENRTRLLIRIIEAVAAECPGLEVGVRLSVFDSIPFAADPETGVGAPVERDGLLPYDFGFGVDRDDPRRPDLAEPLKLLGLLADMGVRLVNLSAGSPYSCAHLQRPAAHPPSDGYLPPEDPLLGVQAQLRAVRQCKAACPDLGVVGTGYSYLQEYLPHVAQHEVGSGYVDFVGLGRMALSYPELPLDVLAGRELDRRRICRTLSDCTTAPRNGLVSGCYPLDPHYRSAPEAQTLRDLKR